MSSANSLSADEYTTTVRSPACPPDVLGDWFFWQPAAVTNMTTPATAITRFMSRSLCSSGTTSFCAVTEIVEQRHAVGFGPDSDLASVLERFVVPLDGLLAIVGDRKVIAGEVHPDGVPHIGRDLHVRALPLVTSSIDGVVDGHVVFQGVGTSNVIIVRVLQSPDHSARLIFFAGDRLELHFHEPVLEASVVLEAYRV